MGVGDGCWPMRPPGEVITRTGMNTCGKQLLCRNCARLAPCCHPQGCQGAFSGCVALLRTSLCGVRVGGLGVPIILSQMVDGCVSDEYAKFQPLFFAVSTVRCVCVCSCESTRIVIFSRIFSPTHKRLPEYSNICSLFTNHKLPQPYPTPYHTIPVHNGLSCSVPFSLSIDT